MPVFRWVLAVGLVLIGCSLGVYLAVPGFPELRQVELTVLHESADGTCTVRWDDPFGQGRREGPYRCDPERDPLLKAPYYDEGSGLGWESGFVLAEGADRGDLYELDQDDGPADKLIRISDALLAVGLLVTIVGLVGGNIRAVARASGVRPQVIRRAWLLSDAAEAVAVDHQRAVEAVRAAWAPLHRELVDERLGRLPVARLRWAVRGRPGPGEWEQGGIRSVRDVLDAGAWELGRLPGVGPRAAGRAVAAARRISDRVDANAAVRVDSDRPDPRTTALLVALQVLVEGGAAARRTAVAGRALAERLEPLLADAEPCGGYREMLRAGPARRRLARESVALLRAELAEAARDRLADRFTQTSVDLLRGQHNEAAGLAARVDFDARPAEYRRVLVDVTGHGIVTAD
ncbi:hypothetical protein ACFVQ0_04055 [Streptomyces sp. NPDC057900]|uniref:hypothetical protein n=1 Tax=Streptomyces sp. NPDC057900 TaxID=3346274 RepID=UPI0036E0CF16